MARTRFQGQGFILELDDAEIQAFLKSSDIKAGLKDIAGKMVAGSDFNGTRKSKVEVVEVSTRSTRAAVNIEYTDEDAISYEIKNSKLAKMAKRKV